MKQETDTLWYADEGKFIVRKNDNAVMGEGINIGVEDSIDNYMEREYTQEEFEQFYANLGMKPPVKATKEEEQQQ